MGKVLMEVLVTILIAGIFLMLYSAIRISDIADRRVREIRSIETFDKQNQLITDNSCVQGGVAMANKEKKIEGRLGFNSQNGRYGFNNYFKNRRFIKYFFAMKKLADV